jgi:hypothetical protein
MAVTPNSIITPQAPRLGLQNFSTVDAAGTYKNVLQGGSNGTKITGIYASSGDTGLAHLMTFQVQRSGTNFGGVAVSVPANAGFANGIPPVNLISTANWPGLPTDSDGNPFLFLQSTLDILVATYATGISTGISATLNAAAVGGDF